MISPQKNVFEESGKNREYLFELLRQDILPYFGKNPCNDTCK